MTVSDRYSILENLKILKEKYIFRVELAAVLRALAHYGLNEGIGKFEHASDIQVCNSSKTYALQLIISEFL